MDDTHCTMYHCLLKSFSCLLWCCLCHMAISTESIHCCLVVNGTCLHELLFWFCKKCIASCSNACVPKAYIWSILSFNPFSRISICVCSEYVGSHSGGPTYAMQCSTTFSSILLPTTCSSCYPPLAQSMTFYSPPNYFLVSVPTCHQPSLKEFIPPSAAWA